MLFSSWSSVLRVVLVGTLAYAALVIVLRVSGKRTLSKMNAFDLVVTVALGSSLATVLLSKDVALVEGVTAFGLLAGLQFALSWASVRFAAVRRVLQSQPAIVFYKGEFLHATLCRERLSDGEIRAAVRQNGLASLDAVEAIVLETDGALSVIPKPAHGARDALVDASHTQERA